MDDGANPSFFIPKEDQVGQAGKWNSLPKYLGYSTNKRNRSNDGKRRAVLEKLFISEFTTDDEDVTKGYLEGWHEPRSEKRMLRILANLSTRTELQINSGASDRKEGKGWSYDSVRAIFGDANWLMKEFGQAFPIIIHGNLEYKSDPILVLRVSLLEWTSCDDDTCAKNQRDQKRRSEEEEWWKTNPLIINNNGDPECGVCGKSFFDDHRYRSYQDLWTRRYNLNKKFEDPVLDLLVKSKILKKVYAHVMRQRAEAKKRGEDHIGAIHADCEEMMWVAGNQIKKHGIELFDSNKHLWSDD